MPKLHPDAVLIQVSGAAIGQPPSVCEHYAGDGKKLRKALALQDDLRGAFDVTADLEDGAASGAEDTIARELCGILAEPRGQAWAVGCRVHPVDHPAFRSDLEILFSARPPGLTYITLPKITGFAQVSQADASIRELAEQHGVFQDVRLQVLAEDEGVLYELHRIAALPRVQFIAFGQMDFTSSHRGAIPASAMKSPGQFDHPLMRRAKLEISAACHAHGKLPTHNPTTDYASPTQAREDALRARHEFGFMRMWSIHPKQVLQILSAFAPTSDEIEDASRILLAAQAADWGPIADRGLLHDRASYRYYWNLLKRAQASGGDISQAARQAFF
ncbi:MAG: CoA ester lyase [Burkholderiaceae bacterium]|nr:CoA ester lyase [Burkholderiaceae bacterium]